MKLTVVIPTYNQAKYVEQAIRSAATQQADFEYEVLVGDDCSTDGTVEILRNLEGEFPSRLRVLYSETNHGMMANYRRTCAAARSQYLAFLEGDDYWTAPDKIRRQVRFLDAHPECVLCFTDAIMFLEEVGVEFRHHAPPEKEICGFEDILEDLFIHTSSVVVRNGPFLNMPSWADGLAGADWPFFIHCAMHGKLGYVPGVTTAYRKHLGGVSSTKPVHERIRGFEIMYDRVNEATNFQHDTVIQVLKRQWRRNVYQIEEILKWIRKSETLRQELEECKSRRRELTRELSKHESQSPLRQSVSLPLPTPTNAVEPTVQPAPRPNGCP
jgi:glycosyltransferase involved in cell wall biosynthesis